MSMIDTFLGLLEKGPDTALLRYSLGNAYYSEKRYKDAIEHLDKAVTQDEGYSAAWKLLGRCYLEEGDTAQAVSVYERGIEIAAEKGDLQAEKEMTVFLKRARKKLQ